jgi:hypothetical protein
MILLVHNPHNLSALREHTFAASHTTSASQAVVWIVGAPYKRMNLLAHKAN